MTPARIALLGAGLIGREHAQLLTNHPQTELVGIADMSDAAKELAGGLGVPLFSDYRTMLDELRPDGAIIALPNQLHVAAGMDCLARKIPMLVEKPIADTVASARELVEAAEKAGVPILVGHHRRHSPDIREARRAIKDGDLGEIVAISGVWYVKKHESYFDTEWRRQPGGGPLLINLIHDIDCFRFLCGDIESVQAIASNKVRGFAVEDTAAVAMRFESGALGTFMLSDAVPSPYVWDTGSGQALYFPTQPEDTYYIGGRNASLAVPTLDLWRPANDGDWRDPMVRHHLHTDRSSCYVNQLDNFVGVIRGQAEPVVSGRDGMMTLATILAIARAAQERREVAVADMLA